jgi:hypothetical protein
MGDKFSVADAYMFTVLRWSPRVNIESHYRPAESAGSPQG